MCNAIPILSLLFLYHPYIPHSLIFYILVFLLFLCMHIYLSIFCFSTVKLPYLFYIPVMALLCRSLCVFCDVIIVVELGLWVCGESWLAIKDCLTHCPSSQGWAPGVLLFVVHCVVSCGIVM